MPSEALPTFDEFWEFFSPKLLPIGDHREEAERLLLPFLTHLYEHCANMSAEEFEKNKAEYTNSAAPKYSTPHAIAAMGPILGAIRSFPEQAVPAICRIAANVPWAEDMPYQWICENERPFRQAVVISFILIADVAFYGLFYWDKLSRPKEKET